MPLGLTPRPARTHTAPTPHSRLIHTLHPAFCAGAAARVLLGATAAHILLGAAPAHFLLRTTAAHILLRATAAHILLGATAALVLLHAAAAPLLRPSAPRRRPRSALTCAAFSPLTPTVTVRLRQ